MSHNDDAKNDQPVTRWPPVDMLEIVNRLVRTHRRLLQAYGRQPTNREIALEMGQLSPEDTRTIKEALANKRSIGSVLEQRWRRGASNVDNIIRIILEPTPLETPIGPGENKFSGNFSKDKALPEPVKAARRQVLKEKLDRIINALSERERKILEMRFGLIAGQTYTLGEISSEVGVTRERIRQIEAGALRKLGHLIRQSQGLLG